MVDEKAAIKIATEFIKAQGLEAEIERFEKANFVSEKNRWACIFSTKHPPGVVESPGCHMVIVAGSTGKPWLFDVL